MNFAVAFEEFFVVLKISLGGSVEQESLELLLTADRQYLVHIISLVNYCEMCSNQFQVFQQQIFSYENLHHGVI